MTSDAMTSDAMTSGAMPPETAEGMADRPRLAPRPSLPLVSVVVVNYNYGRFLDDAVESVFGQSYANIECILVDNASTDESHGVIADLKARHPGLIVVSRDENGGQTAASLDGFSASRGEYVIFLDADDYLLPHCVETHVYVHLSLRVHVGLTSGDMLQVTDRGIVVATGEEASRFVRSGRGRKPKQIRPYLSTPNWPAVTTQALLPEKAHYSPPLSTRWIWSPTSGLCYRRDALALFVDNRRLAKLRTCTDMYFAIACGALCGGVVIDEPLFAYRLHGSNSLTARAQLDRTLSYGIGSRGDNNERAQLFIIDHLVEEAPRFAPNLLLRLNLAALLFRLDRRDHAKGLPFWARHSRVAQAMARHWESVEECFGGLAARLLFMAFSGSFRAPEALADALPEET